jgi:DNA processing protein
MSDLLYQIALTIIHSVGPITAKQLVAYCGGPEAVFRESKKNLLKIPYIGLNTANEILDVSVLQKAEKELEFVHGNKISCYFYLDEAYPSRLKPYNDSPVMLFYSGTQDLNHPRSIGIVGTRKPSPHGSLNCERIIEELKAYDLMIISGLAYGIDSISHRKSLTENIPTIGVMGNGLQITYPALNKNLRQKMEQNGGILTEFLSDTTPEREHFPMRNRIIAALSDATLVIESEKKGGSMITAQFAFSYNKDVFAVPGRPGDKMSEGPNFLIKSNVAALADSAGDIAYKMLWEKSKNKKNKQLKLFTELSEKQKKIIEIIRLQEDKSPGIDHIHHISGLSLSELSALILELECLNIIRSIPGSRYTLI